MFDESDVVVLPYPIMQDNLTSPHPTPRLWKIFPSVLVFVLCRGNVDVNDAHSTTDGFVSEEEKV